MFTINLLFYSMLLFIYASMQTHITTIILKLRGKYDHNIKQKLNKANNPFGRIIMLLIAAYFFIRIFVPQLHTFLFLNIILSILLLQGAVVYFIPQKYVYKTRIQQMKDTHPKIVRKDSVVYFTSRLLTWWLSPLSLRNIYFGLIFLTIIGVIIQYYV